MMTKKTTTLTIPQTRSTVKTTSKTSQSGFTLIELMIAIVLGLLITAAAIQVLVTSQGGLRSQQAVSDLQMDGAFAIDSIVQNVRMANFGAMSTDRQGAFVMNASTPLGGIVLTATDSKAPKPITDANILMDTADMADIASASAVGKSNLASGAKSDRLTIQRRVQRTTYSCDGKEVIATKSSPKQLIESYFVRQVGTKNTDLGLACTSAVYAKQPAGGYALVEFDSDTVLSGKTLKDLLTAQGEVLIDRVDHFHYLLAIDTNTNSAIAPANARLGYVTVADYMSLPNPNPKPNQNPKPRPRIVAIKMAVLVRSATPTSSGIKNSDQEFDILEQKNQKLDTSTVAKAGEPNYQRQVYEPTIFIRNARG